jgi:hypothetical protein
MVKAVRRIEQAMEEGRQVRTRTATNAAIALAITAQEPDETSIVPLALPPPPPPPPSAFQLAVAARRSVTPELAYRFFCDVDEIEDQKWYLAACAAKVRHQNLSLPFDWTTLVSVTFSTGVDKFYNQLRFKDATLEQKVACAAEACSFAVDYVAASDAWDKEMAAKRKVEVLREEAAENQRAEKRRQAEMDAVILLDYMVRVCAPCRKARKTTHEVRCKEHEVCFKALVKSKLA